MPIAMSKSSSTGTCRISSRGCVSRISISAFSLWLPCGNPARRMISSILRRRIGISAALAGHAPALVEALDAHVVEQRVAVHGRARVRLREVEEVGLGRALPDLRREVVEAARRCLLGRLAQDAEAGAGHRRQSRRAVL